MAQRSRSYVDAIISDTNKKSAHAPADASPTKKNSGSTYTTPKTCPYDDVGLWGRISFSYGLRLLQHGYRSPIQLSDLPPLRTADTSCDVIDRLGAEWKARHDPHGNTPSSALWWAVFAAFRPAVIWSAIFVVAESFSFIMQPVLIGFYVDWLDKDGEYGEGAGIAVGLVIISFIQAVSHHLLYYETMKMGWNVRTAFIGLVHQKLLTLPASFIGQTSTGQVISLMSTDVQRFDQFMPALHFGWIGITDLTVIATLICSHVGYAAGFAGVGVMLVSMMLTMRFSKQFYRLRKHIAAYTDSRVKTISEVLRSMLSVKSFAWEVPFSDNIHALRASEAYHIRLTQFMTATNLSLFTVAPVLATFSTFAVRSRSGEDLTLSDVLVVLSLYQVLRSAIGKKFTRFVESAPEAHAAIQRLHRFLCLPPHDHHGFGGSTPVSQPGEKQPVLLDLRNACFAWHPSGPEATAPPHENTKKPHPDSPPQTKTTPPNSAGAGQSVGGADGGRVQALVGVTVRLAAGELLVVAGDVGTGKTAFLLSLLGELSVVSGSVYVGTRKIAYAGQHPWIRAGSLKDNILFGTPYDPVFYDRVIAACCLNEDIAQLVDGEDTEIGEKGINLSGGQKARVSLARCVYSQAPVMLLDDPLSAVDPHVAKRLYNDVIRGLLEDRAVVLVTHHPHFMRDADKILYLGVGGVPLVSGAMRDVRDKLAAHVNMSDPTPVSSTPPHSAENEDGHAMDSTSREHVTHDPTKPTNDSNTAAAGDASDDMSGEKPARREDPDPPPTAPAMEGVGNSDGTTTDDESTAATPSPRDGGGSGGGGGKASTQLVLPEDRVLGIVTWATYKHYIQHAGYWLSSTVGLLFITSQALLIAVDWFLQHWATRAPDEQDRSWYLKVYGSIVAAASVSAFVRSFSFFTATLQSATGLHNAAFIRVLRAPMAFFTANPLGRIINRFSADQGQVDTLLPVSLSETLNLFSITLGTLLFACIAIPWLALTIPFLVWYLVHIREFATASLRELKRLDGTTRSPVQIQFTASLVGLVAIRAFGAVDDTQATFVRLLEQNAKAWYWWLIGNRWIGFRLDIMCTVLVAVSVALSMGLRGHLDTGLLGLAFVYINGLSGLFQYMVRQSALVETYMTSVERLLYYSRRVVREEDDPTAEEKSDVNVLVTPDSSWPSSGSIVCRNVHARYRHDLPDVLHGVSFVAAAGSKLGIVGRTGAGKSSLVQSLFRLNEISGGSIAIDGLNIAHMPLHSLRSKLGLIPQEAELFSGTVRYNIDPFHAVSDDELRRVLHEVRLDGVELTAVVSEGGGNFSAGQRQLISLARAMVRRPKVVVIDEATANVDYATDAIVQRALRESEWFRGATLLLIAHRIHTIADSDLIVVLEAGCVVEHGDPTVLRHRRGSKFGAMIDAC